MTGIEGDYLTNTGFFVIVAILCALALVVLTAELLRERGDDSDDEPEHPWPMRLCPGHHYEALDGLWICSRCGDTVRQPLPYDQGGALP